MTVIDLTTRRVERLEKQQKEANDRLGRVEGALDQIVSVLEVHSRHFERMEAALYGIADRVDTLTGRVELLTNGVERMTTRIDGLARAITIGRTRDLVRFDAFERRLKAQEKSRRRKPARH